MALRVTNPIAYNVPVPRLRVDAAPVSCVDLQVGAVAVCVMCGLFLGFNGLRLKALSWRVDVSQILLVKYGRQVLLW